MDSPAARRMAPADAVSVLDIPRIQIRDEIVEHRGQPALALVDTTPAQAVVADLQFIRRILLDRFGVMTTRHLANAPTPLRRSVLEEMEREFTIQFKATAASPFRSRTDISVTNSLYHYYALLAGRAVIQRSAKFAYVVTAVRSDLDAMDRLLKRRSNHFFCLNDGGREELGPKQRRRRVTEFLERYFPVPAPWESK